MTRIHRIVAGGTLVTEPGVTLPSAPGDFCFFAYVDPDEIPRTHRKRARRYIDRAARDLSLPGRVRIRWFRHVMTLTPPEPGFTPAGWFGPEGKSPPYDFSGPPTAAANELFLALAPPDQPMTIALNRGLQGDVLAAVCAHEVRHLLQDRAGMTGPAREADADAYAARFVRGAA